MRYLCVHCDHRFDLEEGHKPRCPKCMRRHGLERIESDRDDSKPSGRRWVIPAVVIGIVVAIVVGYFIWADEAEVEVVGEPPLRPLSADELNAYAREENVDFDELANFLVASDEVAAFAEAAVRGKSGAMEQAEGVVHAIRTHARSRAFEPWSLSVPRQTPLRNVSRVVQLVKEDGEEHHLYPLEVAALAVVALRSQDVPAMLTEVYSFPADRSPPDPSGKVGYFAVAVYPGEVGQGEPTIFDPYAGHPRPPAAADYRVLSDVQVMGAALNHLAVYRLVHEGDDERAHTLSTRALRLDRRSPVLRTTLGLVHVAQMNYQEAFREWEAASELREDSPRRKYMATLQFELASSPGGGMQNVERARTELEAALEAHPDYADAHALMAAVRLADYAMAPAESLMQEARVSLETAEHLDPELPDLPLLWANYYLQNQDLEHAVSAAREAVDRSRHNWRTRLIAAQIFKHAGEYDAMREQARAIMDLVPRDESAQVQQVIEATLGPTALEAEDVSAEDEGDDSLPLPDGQGFQLGQDSKLLGDGENDLGTMGALSMDGEFELSGPGGSGLQLRDPGEGLQLNLEDE